MSEAVYPPVHDPGQGELRVPPHEISAEQTVLGSMLISPEAIAMVIGILKSTDFYVPKHEIIYASIRGLYETGDPVDVVTLINYMTKQGKLGKIGGADYLYELMNSVPTAANADYYAEVVQEKALLRRMINAGTKIVQMGYAQEGDPVDLVNAAQSEIYRVTGDGQAEDYVSLDVALEAAMEDIELASRNSDGMTGIATGFAELDTKTTGFSGGQMIIIAARPAIGKSTFALDVARAAAIRSNKTTVFFSLEMGRSEIAMRLISAEASVPLGTLRSGQLDDRNWAMVADAQARVSGKKLFIDDSPNMSLAEIRAKCRRLKQRDGLEMVVIDYLQLLSSGKRSESRQQEVSEFSRALKLLAKELDVPVVALSQLNRASEARADKRPMMSDLRESGSLEQDADVVILLHRDADPKLDRSGEADIILAKQRNGPTGTIHVAFQGMYSRFRDMPQEVVAP
ncbi:replicative DNA helicase [Canibacter sp. lx-45]|uniref:replicative DNA helicase n=1 Tax=Canibacter zhuwentaonis TaxID=2837491 RepID=UPI001BDD890A|nr:replicative DNA helicase [Canibacter zhuwentaonis]MBT1035402.1 replicative DNA helicase [Canibacter zhuwentaonis]